MNIDQPKRGRPEARIDTRQLEKLAMLACTVEEAAAFLGVSKRTLLRRLEEPDCKGAWEVGRNKGNVSLRRLQLKHAQGTGSAAVAMTIHLSKHRLGENDKSLLELSGKGGGPIPIMDAAKLASLTDTELSLLERLFDKLSDLDPKGD